MPTFREGAGFGNPVQEIPKHDIYRLQEEIQAILGFCKLVSVEQVRFEDMASPLGPVTRLITTHNADGKAVFSTTLSEQPEQKKPDGKAVFTLSYATDTFPVDMNNDKDLVTYQKYSAEAPGLVISSGTVLRHVDAPPGALSPMHRTVSLDYGIVIEGEMELILDSGERKKMVAGDIAIQRGTMHAWRNMSDTKWARMLYILQPSEPLEVGGKKLEEDLETMQGVRAST